MKIEFTPLTASLIPACREFNQRMRAHSHPPFLLPEDEPRERLAVAPRDVLSTHYVGVDESGAVRGGMMLVEQRGWLHNEAIPLINVQSPLSEGIVDRKFSGIGLQMLQFVKGRSPYAYAVGMGSQQNAFARLLDAAGWWVGFVPFQFAVIRAVPFLSEMRALRKGNRRWLARAAAASGLGSLALAAWRFIHPDPDLKRYSLEAATSWPCGTGTVWEHCCSDVSFSVLRDETALAALYPDTEPRLRRFVLHFCGDIVGWSVGLVTTMHEDSNFGDLVVGTVLDGLACEGHLPALLALTREALANLGAEVMLTNQTHHNWHAESRRLGFLSSSSNYLLALSKPLAVALHAQPSALTRMHVNRGDGDGRIHL